MTPSSFPKYEISNKPRAIQSAIVWWIERTYHRKRRQAALGRLTPIEFETMMATPAAVAA